VEIDDVLGEPGHLLHEPVGHDHAGTAVGIAGEDAVEIDVIERVDVRLRRLEPRHIDERKHDNDAVDPLRRETAPEAVGGLDAGILRTVDTGADDHPGTRPAAVDDANRHHHVRHRPLDDRQITELLLSRSRLNRPHPHDVTHSCLLRL
jgi:hypothetical protein